MAPVHQVNTYVNTQHGDGHYSAMILIFLEFDYRHGLEIVDDDNLTSSLLLAPLPRDRWRSCLVRARARRSSIISRTCIHQHHEGCTCWQITITIQLYMILSSKKNHPNHQGPHLLLPLGPALGPRQLGSSVPHGGPRPPTPAHAIGRLVKIFIMKVTKKRPKLVILKKTIAIRKHTRTELRSEVAAPRD